MMRASQGSSALAQNGMVATPHELATRAGLDALRDGGTAADAVVAANAVLTVIYPDQTTIGGDCFFLVYDAEMSELHGFNGSGRAPAAADREQLLAAGYTQMPTRGIYSVTVPGTIDAWDQLACCYGCLGLDRLLQPAIGYARDGFPASPAFANRLLSASEVIAGSDYLRSIYLANGTLPAAGDQIRIPALADSLDLISREGRDAFYTGALAGAIVSTSDRLGGWLTADDLAGHCGEWVTPLTTTYRGVTVAELPPNSQGLTSLIGLNLVEQVALPESWGSADHLHPLIEAKKLSFAVRDQLLTDPDFAPIDTAKLASKSFATELWRTYDSARAMTGIPAIDGDTVYLCAVDRDGNAASLIQSLYMSFGSAVVAGDTGITLQNRGSYFSLDAGHVNRLEGGKRTLHTLMPAMLLRDGRLLGPIGTQGGDAQAQIHLQLIPDLVDYGFDPQQAIDAPRWLSGGGGSLAVALEASIPDETERDLATRGHLVSRVQDWDPTFGHAQMILRDGERGHLTGGADPRADGLALGY